ncbi:hypothetical protein SAMN05444336_101250 [Albimonas donghaensis]|uniref:Uncharacterized protein n=1 Tax=Albimonas donghaensis TaxID=356660 RepID=A0A1H2R7X8_9RHOB|nr:hypothetical protein [Albimonas donghaensis]SDW14954.1 hypothetical protein SAMN05444336_101250 [Albimonas donghaensis]
MTMIENSERGLTIAKPLAWSILVALVCGGIWVGSQIGTLAEVQRQVAENRKDIAALSGVQRLAAVENARLAEKVSAILDGVKRIETRLDRLERERRGLPSSLESFQ